MWLAGWCSQEFRDYHVNTLARVSLFSLWCISVIEDFTYNKLKLDTKQCEVWSNFTVYKSIMMNSFISNFEIFKDFCDITCPKWFSKTTRGHVALNGGNVIIIMLFSWMFFHYISDLIFSFFYIRFFSYLFFWSFVCFKPEGKS